MGKSNGLPRNVTEFKDRHGNWHLRYRAKGAPVYYFKHKPGTEEFRAELDACRAGTPIAKAERTAQQTKPGSISALIAMYYGTPEYTGLAASSKKTYRSTLERFRKVHGSKQVATIERKHIKAILGGASNQQIKAVTGHVTDTEVARYTAAADQARLADQAINALYRDNIGSRGR